MEGGRNSVRPVLTPVRSQTGIYPMLARIPGVQLLFLGPQACTRHGLISTLQELHRKMAFLCLTETEVVTGRYLDKTAEAAGELVRRRKASSLLLITCCQNALVGTDYDRLITRIQGELGLPVKYLEVNRLQMYARRKGALMSRPTEQLIYDFLLPREKSARPWVNLIGPPGVRGDGETAAFLQMAGAERVYTIDRCGDFAGYQDMAGAHLNVALTRSGEETARYLEEKLGIPWLPLNAGYDEELLARQYMDLGAFLGCDAGGWLRRARERLEKRLEGLERTLPELEVDGRGAADGIALANWLWRRGFAVKTVWLDSWSGREEKAEEWLTAHHPETALCRQPYRPALNPTPPNQLRRAVQRPIFPTGYEVLHQAVEQLEAMTGGGER